MQKTQCKAKRNKIKHSTRKTTMSQQCLRINNINTEQCQCKKTLKRKTAILGIAQNNSPYICSSYVPAFLSIQEK